MIPTQICTHRSPINHTVKTTPCWRAGSQKFSERQYTPVKDTSKWYVSIQCRQYVCIWFAWYIISFLLGMIIHCWNPLMSPFFVETDLFFVLFLRAKNVSTWLQLNSNKAVRKSGAQGNPLKQDQEHQQKTHVGEDVKVTLFSHIILTLRKWWSQPVSLYISYSLAGHGNALAIVSFQMLGPK